MPLLAKLTCAWMLGIIISDFHYTTVALCLGGVLGLFFCVKKKHIPLLYVVISIAGMGRMYYAQVSVPYQPFPNAQWYTISDNRTNWQAQKITAFAQDGQGLITTLPLNPAHYPGEAILLTGQPQRLTSNYAAYQAQMDRRHIYVIMNNPQIKAIIPSHPWRIALEQWRYHSQHKLQQLFAEPMSSIVIGMLIGLNGDVSEATAQSFRQTGTSHILVISGWNISIVAVVCMQITARLQQRPWLRAGVVIGAIIVYVLATGASAAVMRAGVMGVAVVIGKTLDRPRNAWNMLALAAWGMSAYDPSVLWDLGFQLSSLATLGLVAFSSTIDTWLEHTPFAHPTLTWGREGLAATLAAQMTTWPLMLCRLGLPSPWSILANIIITPVVPFAMATGTLTLVCAWIVPVLAPITTWMAYPAFQWIIVGSQVLATWPAPTRIIIDNPWLEWLGHASWVGYIVVLHWQNQQGAAPHTTDKDDNLIK
jgi:competence protein ComEC